MSTDEAPKQSFLAQLCGCLGSSPPVESKAPLEEQAPPKAAPAETPKEKPQPQIFAIMRNGHEVLRGGMTEVQTALDKDDMESAKEEWRQLMKWQVLHARMEEGDGNDGTPRGFFK